MINATLVLEGGGTRGVFTAGILDYLMEQDIYLSHVIGVSAGACNAMDYLSKQIGRTRDCFIPNEKNPHPMMNSPKEALKQKELMNMELAFNLLPYELIPFDF
ncbi:MAG: patatin-like phospholipase family protein, partial [Lachnospiraceae bacterium]|nr:patatin-like phospholipase family protein [Lachnospiraceae bacterium]